MSESVEEKPGKDTTTTKHPPGYVPFSERAMAGLARERIIASLRHRASADILDQAKKTYVKTREVIDTVNSKLTRMAREGFKINRGGTPMIRLFVPKDSMVEATIVSVDVTSGNPVVNLYAVDVVAKHPMTGLRGGPQQVFRCAQEGTDVCHTRDRRDDCNLPGKLVKKSGDA